MNKPITEEQKEVIRKMYPDHFASDIAPLIDLHRTTITVHAKAMGIAHDPKWYASAISERYRETQTTPGIREAKSAHQRGLIAKERRRILNGEGQKTRYKVRILPQRYIDRMDYMVREYKYFRGDNPNACVLYYDSQTKRSARAEKTSLEEYGITFKQGDE